MSKVNMNKACNVKMKKLVLGSQSFIFIKLIIDYNRF